MKQKNAPPHRKLLLLACTLFGLLMFSGSMSAQQAISIIWDSETGCLVYDDKREKYVEDIYDGPCVRVCEHSTVTYSLTGDSSGWQSTAWNVAGGTVVNTTLTTCTVVWGNTGAGTVTASVTKQDDTVQVIEKCIEIIISPTALFGVMPDLNADPIRVCLDDTIYFTNLSSTNGGTALMSYYWDFGDGNTSAEFEPSHSYDHDGVYTVTLTVTNTCNCTSTYEIKVVVKKGGFEIMCPSVVCDGESATYSIPDFVIEGCHNSGYNWSVIGGHIISPQPYGPQIEVVWDAVDESGFGYVSFDANGCELECPGITTIKVPVIQNNATINGEITVCTNEQNIYKLPQWPSTIFNWTVDSNGTGATLINGELPNEVILTTTSTSGQIVLNATYHNTLLNCGGTATLVINILPRAIIQGPTTFCVGGQGSYSIQGGYSGSWTLTGPGGTVNGSGPGFNHTFATAGNYTLTVSGATFCKPGSLAIIVKDKEPAPTAILGPDFACPGVPETYSVNNTIAGTQIGWEVVNGTIEGSEYGDEITVTFGPSGPYIVKAWRESTSEPNCPSDIITRTITLPPVNLDITSTSPNIVCASSYADYATSYADGETYSWSVFPATVGSVSQGNGTQNVTVLWNQINYPGAQVILTVTKCGTEYTHSFAVDVVTVPPVTLVNPIQEICRGQGFSLQLAGLTQGMITWNFGDGNTYTSDASLPGGLTMNHTYTAINSSSINYIVTIEVQGPNGCVSAANLNHSIDVIPAPVASITPGGNYAICPESSMNELLQVNIQGGFTNVVDIEWFRNGVSLSSGLVPSMNATSYGNYYAVVTNNQGCSTTTNVVNFNGNCNVVPCNTTATVTVSGSNNCGVISAVGTASPSPNSTNWYTQPAASSQSTTGTTGQFTFTESGTYRIFYQAIYGNCAVTEYTDVVVPYMPELKYSVTCGSTPGTYDVTLLDNSNYHPLYPITNWQFSVNGSNVGTGTTTTHTVSLAPGTYQLGLTVQGSGHPSCSITPITLVLPNMPNAQFSFPPQICENAPAALTPLSPQPGLTYEWELAPGIFNLQQNASWVFLSPGSHDVILTVTNQYGCSSTRTETITVVPNGLAGSIQPLTSTACEGNPIMLQYVPNSGTAIPDSYEWKKGNVVVGTGSTFNATQSGSYTVTVGSNLGCVTTVSTAATVTFIKLPPAHISGPTAVCSGSGFTLSNPDAGTDAEYYWTRNGSALPAFNDMRSISQTLTTLGTYTYEITVQIPDGMGGYCVSTDTHTVTVNPLPATPSINFAMIDCDTYTFKLTASAPGTGTYTWSNGMTGQTIYVTQGGPYQVRFTNESGCFRTAQVDLPKDPSIHLWTVPTGCYTLCKQLIDYSYLMGPAGIPFPYWEWQHNYNVVDAGSGFVNDLQVNANGAGIYQLALDNGYCTRVSDEVSIDAYDCPECELRVRIKDIKKNQKETYCSYIIYFDITNPYGMPIQVTITDPFGNGLFVPSGITVNPGTAVYQVEMIPLNGFNGGPMDIIFETIIEGKPCITRIRVDFPPCTSGHRLAGGEAEAGRGMNNLIVSPNPASTVAEFTYTYADNSPDAIRSIEVYSLLGVLLESHNPKEPSGTWKANLDRYPAGQYIVVMRLNGSMVMQKSLILR